MKARHFLVPVLIGLIGVESLFEDRRGSGNLREIQTVAESRTASGVARSRDSDVSGEAEFAAPGFAIDVTESPVSGDTVTRQAVTRAAPPSQTGQAGPVVPLPPAAPIGHRGAPVAPPGQGIIERSASD